MFGAHFAVHFPHQIEQLRIGRDVFVAPPVAQNPVDLFQRLAVVTAVALIGDGEVFLGMDVMQRDRAGIAIGDRVLQAVASDNEGGGSEAKTASGARCEQERQNSARDTNRHVQSRVGGQTHNKYLPRLRPRETWLTQCYRDGLMHP
jgi:hypothetical protein